MSRLSSTLTDVHMDTSTKLATFSVEEEVLTESNCVGCNFNILSGLFANAIAISLRQDYIFIFKIAY